MDLLQFSETWIEKNIETNDIYGDAIKNKVAELVDLFINQKHSGASASLTLKLFVNLMKDYSKQ